MKKLTIRVGNITSKIIEYIGPETQTALKKALSYIISGSQFSTYAQLGWDGTKNLFNTRNNTFPTGLLRKAREVLYSLGYEVILEDTRVKPTGFPILLKNVKLRDYQEECVKEMCRVGRGLIHAATSSGKTIITSALLANLGVNSLVIVPTKELLKQTSKEIERFLGIKVGIIGDGEKDIGKITVATFQSLTTSKDTKRRKYDPIRNKWSVVDDKEVTVRPDLKEYLENVECVFTDECFPKGTQVITDKGNKSIEKIQIGHRVASFNKDSLKIEYKSVVRLFKKIYSKPLYKIIFDNKKEIFCTDNHPFYVFGNQGITKIPANALKIGLTVFYCSEKSDAAEKVKIFKIEQLSNKYNNLVYNIEVKDNHNYFANNILVSNCHHLAASSLQQIYDVCPNAFYRYGVSATPFREQDSDILIEAVTGRVLKRISASYLITHNWISQPFIHLIQFKQDRLPTGTTYAKAYEQRVIKNAERNDLVRRLAEMEADKGNSVLISVRQINHGEIIYKLLKDKYKDKVVFLNSKVNSNDVSETLQKLSKKEVLIVIGTSILSEGVNIPSLDALIFASCPKSNVLTLQLCGRVLRRTKTKNTVNIYDIQDYGCKYLTSASKERINTYMTEPAFILLEEGASKYA